MSLGTYWRLAKSAFDKYPTYVIFFVTSKCDSRCRTCFYWKNLENPEKNELTLDEIKKISEKSKPFIYLTISGGEPFLRQDLPEIVETFVGNNKVEYVSIPTNCLNPEKIAGMSEKIFKRLPDTSFRIILALDGVGRLHDDIRGVPGNFEKFLATYEKLDALRKRYNNFDLDINTVLSSYNEPEIEGILEYVANNLAPDNHGLALIRGDTREKVAKDVSPETYKRAAGLVEATATGKNNRRNAFGLRLLKTIKLVMRDVIFQTLAKNEAGVKCKAGEKMIVIAEDGSVYPCEMLGKDLGNLRENDYDVGKIISSEKAARVRNWIKETDCHCTFECAIQNSIPYDVGIYPQIIKKFLKLN